MLPDGTLEILGRINTQIKLRCVHIEAEGVSAVLRNASSSSQWDQARCRDARHHASFSWFGRGSRQFRSFVEEGGHSSESERYTSHLSAEVKDGKWVREIMPWVQEAVNRELANYMRPAYIAPVGVLPLSMNGKTDEKVLVQMFRDTEPGVLLAAQNVGWSSSSTSRPAAQEQERKVPENGEQMARLIRKIKGAAGDVSLGPESNAFECGLYSSGLARLAKELGRGIVIPEVTAKGTVAGIAGLLGSSSESSSTSTQSKSEGQEEEAILEAGAKAIPCDKDALLARAVAVFDPSTIERVLPPFPVQEGVLK